MNSKRLTLFVTTGDDCPAQFCFAFPTAKGEQLEDWQSAWQFTGGRGLHLESAAIGAIGEAAECLSVWSRGEDDPLVSRHRARQHKPPETYLNLSVQQLRRLMAEGQTPGEPEARSSEQIPNPDNRFLEYRDSHTGNAVWVPSLCGLIGEEPWHGIAGERLVSTNGTAIADDFGTAADKAMFELIERDAVAIWWYNRVLRPRLPADLLDEAGAHDLRLWLDERADRVWWIVDVSSDIDVPVVAALSCNADGSMMADGYAAGRTWQEAGLGAVLEMLQAETSLAFMEMKAERESSEEGGRRTSAFYQATLDLNVFEEGFLAGLPETGSAPRDVERTAAEVDRMLREKDIDLLVADITRPDIGIPAARAISASLRDWRPRFGPGRLYSVPVDMGWLAEANTEDTLNPRTFLT